MRDRIAALDTTTGVPTSWDRVRMTPSFRSPLGPTVYAGGQFTSIGGQFRSRLGAIDATTGIATSWNPGAIGPARAIAIAPDDSVWVGGSFRGLSAAPQRGIAHFVP